MKLPTVEQIANEITLGRAGYSIYTADSSYGKTGYALTTGEITKAAERIIKLLKEVQFDESTEAPEIDPNLVKIAELEAKILVYESVISSAGIKLGMPKKNNANRVRAQKGEAK